MAAKMYRMPVGEAKRNSTAVALVGTETINATVLAGTVAVVIDDGTVTENSNIVVNSLKALIEVLQEANKA